jgi:hypothetical protein
MSSFGGALGPLILTVRQTERDGHQAFVGTLRPDQREPYGYAAMIGQRQIDLRMTGEAGDAGQLDDAGQRALQRRESLARKGGKMGVVGMQSTVSSPRKSAMRCRAYCRKALGPTRSVSVIRLPSARATPTSIEKRGMQRSIQGAKVFVYSPR